MRIETLTFKGDGEGDGGGEPRVNNDFWMNENTGESEEMDTRENEPEEVEEINQPVVDN